MIRDNISFSGRIVCKTGLHIGNIEGGCLPRGLDAPVLQNPILQIENKFSPYISASAFRGKLRNIAEYLLAYDGGLNKNFHDYNVQEKKENFDHKKLYRHECKTTEAALNCSVCGLFGIGGEGWQNFPGRLIFRNVKLISLTNEPQTKFENTLKRLVREANPRILERVPVNTIFQFNIFYRIHVNDKLDQTIENLQNLIGCMRFLEDYYLGGNGSRGYGNIYFSCLEIEGYSSNNLNELCSKLAEKEFQNKLMQRREYETE